MCPPAFSASILSQVSDSHFHALVLHNGLAVLSIYLPDSGKSDHVFESALNRVAAGLDHLILRHRPQGIIIGGDLNVEFVTAEGTADILGECLWPTLRHHRYSEREDMVMAFCSCFSLVHGPSRIPGEPEDRWTRESWGSSAVRTALNHVLLTRNLALDRWKPWPETRWPREKHLYWGDHRPILASIVNVADGGRDRFQLATLARAPSYKGWQLNDQTDTVAVRARLSDRKSVV